MRLTFWNERKAHYDWHCENNEIADKLAAYEDAEEQGRLVILPCKVGDTIYGIFDGKIWDGEVYHISYSDYYGKITATAWAKQGNGAAFEHFGKTVFLIRAEAEAALKGGQNDVLYEELVKLARHCAEKDACINCPVGGCEGSTGLMNQLADAIEELNKRLAPEIALEECWHRLENRPLPDIPEPPKEES